jgi:hypothetical protein
MQRFSHCRFEATLVALAAVAAVTSGAVSARAQGYEPPNSLPWPLYTGDASLANGQNGGPGQTAPRPGVGNVLGEYQRYSTEQFLHSGDDIRGVQNDPIFAVADGNVWLKANFASVVNNEADFCVNSSICRFYVAGTDKRYVYYYSHVRLDPAAPNYSAAFHDKIVEASATAPAGGTFPSLTFSAGTRINRGDFLTGIADFAGWNHLHFGIIDATQNFDVINPLTGLTHAADGVELVDDERPTIVSLAFFQNESTTQVTPAGDCHELASAGNLDIVAQVKDSFYSTDPAPAGLTGDYSTIGPYGGEYRIERVGGGEVQPVVWYDFSRAPLRCAGSQRGLACPTRPSTDAAALQQFLAHSLLADEGALNPGSLGATDYYASVLFSSPLSDSTNFKVTDGEKHFAVLTNSWGQPGSWNTAAASDGLYRVSAETRDQAGNRTASSQLVFVNNTGSLPQSFRDAYIRDNSVETGALPSTLGGQPFWTSPDIVITKGGVPLNEARVVAGQTYQVYLDVHNPTCGDVHGVKVRLFTANPSMIVNEADWVDFSGGFTGSVDVPALGMKRIGPFDYTPTTNESSENEGHRCMLAMFDGSDDPIRLGVDKVASDNNIAQLNLQVDAVAFSIRNPEPQAAELELEFRCNRFPINTAGALAQMRVASDPALVAAWAHPEGATVTVDGSDLLVRYDLCNVKLPKVTLAGGTLLPASMNLVLPPSVTGNYSVDFSQYTNGSLSGGMTFSVSREDEPPVPR